MFLLGDLVSFELLVRLLVAALLWVLLHHLIRFHPRGIEIVGAIILFLGLIWWITTPLAGVRIAAPFGPLLLLVGIAVHGIGRMLYRLRTGRHGSRQRG